MHCWAVFAVAKCKFCFIRLWKSGCACGVACGRNAWHPRTPERSITHDRTSLIYTMPLVVSCSYTSCHLFKYHNVHHAERRCSEEAHFLGLFVLSLSEGEGEALSSAQVLDNHDAHRYRRMARLTYLSLLVRWEDTDML